MWITSPELNTNSMLFNGRGTGFRDPLLGWLDFKSQLGLWTSTEFASYTPNAHVTTITTNWIMGTNNKLYGYCVRPVRNSTNLSDGETGVYVGNNGDLPGTRGGIFW